MQKQIETVTTVIEMKQNNAFVLNEIKAEQNFINGVMFGYKEIKEKDGIQAAYEYAATQAKIYYNKDTLEKASQYMLDRMNVINYWEEKEVIKMIPGRE